MAREITIQQFHEKHAKDLILSEDRTAAQAKDRLTGDQKLFSAEPLQPCHSFTVKVKDADLPHVVSEILYTCYSVV